MKKILEFDGNDDEYNFYCAVHGADYRIAFEEFDNWLRSKIKYGEDLTTTYPLIQEELRSIINQYDIKVNE